MLEHGGERHRGREAGSADGLAEKEEEEELAKTEANITLKWDGSRRKTWSNGEAIMPCLRGRSYIIASRYWLPITLRDAGSALGVCREQRACVQREETARAVKC